jgi:hypothetical protein
MADIFAIFGLLLTLGILFPGMLTAWWLLFPATVERARLRLERTPWQCLWLGLGSAILIGIPILGLLALPTAVTKFMGGSLLTLVLALAGLGTAGMAAKMGDQWFKLGGEGLSPTGAFVRGAVALELAAAFPIIGWFIVIPLATIVALGATAFALFRWLPRTDAASEVQAATRAEGATQASAGTLAQG